MLRSLVGSEMCIRDSYRCVFNLVDNAIKYGGEHGSVTVRVAREGGDVSLSLIHI